MEKEIKHKNTVYTFHRIGGFYPIELKDDIQAIHNAEINSGTIKVINTSNNKLVWRVEALKK